MAVIRWLHLTDLHAGADGQDCPWPNIDDAFLDDLGRPSGETAALTSIWTPLEWDRLKWRGVQMHEDMLRAVAKA